MDIERMDTIDVKCSVSKEERERSPAAIDVYMVLFGMMWTASMDVDKLSYH